MRVLWHFIKRDFLDFRIWWSVFAVMHLIMLAAGQSAQAYLWMWWMYMMFAIFYGSLVWNSGAGMFPGIGRTTLRSLPLNRRKMFVFSILRCMVGSLPGAIFLYSQRAQSAVLFKSIWVPSLPKEIYLVGLLFSTGVFLAITNTSDTFELMQKAVGRWYRVRLVLVMMFEGLFGLGFQIAWVVAGCGLMYADRNVDYGLLLGVMAAALGFHSVLAWRRYRQWCWD